jgi:hypothetical protein
MRHHTPGTFRGAQSGDFVIGAADLERADALEILGLENDGIAGTLVEEPGGEERRGVDDGTDNGFSSFDIGESDHAVEDKEGNSSRVDR